MLEYGEVKYAAHDWRKGFKYRRIGSALLRHIMGFLEGEDIDPESGLSHLSHAAACLMILDWSKRTKPELDDRFKPPVS